MKERFLTLDDKKIEEVRAQETARDETLAGWITRRDQLQADWDNARNDAAREQKRIRERLRQADKAYHQWRQRQEKRLGELDKVRSVCPVALRRLRQDIAERRREITFRIKRRLAALFKAQLKGDLTLIDRKPQPQPQTEGTYHEPQEE